MFSYEERMRAVLLYIKYGCRSGPVISELGYPKRQSLRLWYKQYKETGSLTISYQRKSKYSNIERNRAIQHYLSHGKCIDYTIRELGYPCKELLLNWIRKDCPEERQALRCGEFHATFKKEVKEQAVVDFCTRSGSAQEVADTYGMQRQTLYKWKRQLLPEGRTNMLKKKRNFSDNPSELKQEIDRLQEEASQLNDEVYRLRLEKEVLEKAAEIIKKDQGVSLRMLSNSEKATVIDALRDRYSLKELLSVFHMAKSSYCYQIASRKAPSKYIKITAEIRTAFEESHGRYGYRRINIVLKRRNLVVSDKVVRRIMKEEQMLVSSRKRRKYSSYQGEITPAVENVIQRNFHASIPNSKWLTDITEFHIPAGKVYLSPIIDCFDGLPVAWTIGTSPDAELVNTMLDEAILQLHEGERPIVHHDRGAHYRWPGWIERMDAAGLTRSMSKKGCSPDNSACEGFFGRLKNEMFYNRTWEDVSLTKFMDILDQYIHWYAEERIKISLGGMSPLEYRINLGLCG